MDKLVPAFEQSIFQNILEDGIRDIAEIGIDSVLNDGLLKDLPIFSVLFGTIRTVKSIRERNFLKNTALFIYELNAKKIDAKKIAQYKEKLKDNAVAEQELGRVLIILDQYIDTLKSKELGKLFRRYVDQEYSWGKFCELSDILGRLFIDDFAYLKEIIKAPESTAKYHIYKIPSNIKRLESLGLVEIFGEYSRFGDKLLQSENMCVQLTDNGKIFIELEEN